MKFSLATCLLLVVAASVSGAWQDTSGRLNPDSFHTIPLISMHVTHYFDVSTLACHYSARSFSDSINVSIDSEIKNEIDACFDECAKTVTDGSKGRSSSRFIKLSKGTSRSNADKFFKVSKGGDAKGIADEIEECNLECFLDDSGSPNRRARAVGNDGLISLGECTSKCASDAENDLSKGYGDADKKYDDCLNECTDGDNKCEKDCDDKLKPANKGVAELDIFAFFSFVSSLISIDFAIVV